MLAAPSAFAQPGPLSDLSQIYRQQPLRVAMPSFASQPFFDAAGADNSGIDVELFNWRGVFAPPGVSDEDKAAMVALVDKMVASPSWAEECKNRNWTSIPLTGDAFATFLAEDTKRIEAILKDLGLA